MAEFRRQSQDLAEAAELVVIDLGQPAAENLAVTGLRAAEPVAVAVGRRSTFEATLKNFGRQPRDPADGRAGDRRPPRPPSRSSTCRPAARPPSGSPTVSRRPAITPSKSAPTATPWTSTTIATWSCPCGSRSACCASTAGPPASRFTARPTIWPRPWPRKAGRGERAAVERGRGRGEAHCWSATWAATIACFCPTWPSSRPARPACWTPISATAATWSFFLGDQVSADRYNRELGGRPGRRRFLPARLGQRSSQSPATALDPLGYRHPIVAAVPRPGEGRAADHARREVLQAGRAQGHRGQGGAGAGNGDPLMVTEPIRRGRVVLVATSADTSWTCMPVWPSYVPLVQEMLAWCVSGQSQQRNVRGRASR